MYFVFFMCWAAFGGDGGVVLDGGVLLTVIFCATTPLFLHCYCAFSASSFSEAMC